MSDYSIENGLKRGNIHVEILPCKDMDIIWLLKNSKSPVCSITALAFIPYLPGKGTLIKVDCPRISKQSSALY